MQLEQMRDERDKLLNHILSLGKPVIEERSESEEDPKRVIKRRVPWHMIQRELERKDREEFNRRQAEAKNKFENLPKEEQKDIEKLEEELNVS